MGGGVAAGVTAGLLCVLLGGCNTSALSKRELIVHFAAGTPEAQQLADRAACLHATSAAVPEPLPTNDKYASDRANEVRFRIDHANDKQISVLVRCFDGHPEVVGVDTPDVMG